MLQEKSCKNLTNAIHKAFARIFFDEYKNRLLNIDNDRSPMSIQDEQMSFTRRAGQAMEEQDHI
jgi:hypothetical protein